MAKFCGKCGAKLDERTGKCPNCEKEIISEISQSDNSIDADNKPAGKTNGNSATNKELSKKEVKAAKRTEKKAIKKAKKRKHIFLRIIAIFLFFAIFTSGVSGVLAYFDIVDIPVLSKLMDIVGITNDTLSYESQSSESCYIPNEENIIYENEDKSFGYVNNMILVFFSSEATETQITETVTSVEGKIVGKIEGINQYQIQVTSTTRENLEKSCEQLLKYNWVKNAIVDYVVTATTNETPNDPWKDTFQGAFGVDWSENEPSGTNWWFEATKILSAWEYSDYFSDIKVGVVDNGYDTGHEDLNITVLNNDVNNYENHGTHVAGVIGATVNNNKGISGILKDVSLYGVDCYSTSKQENNNITVSSLYDGINLCIQNDCKVINMSSGIKYTDKDETKNVSYEMSKYAANCIVYLLDSYGKDFLVVQSAGNGDDWGKGVNAKDYNGWFSGIDEDLVQELFDEYKQKGVTTEHQITVQDVMDSFMVVAAVDEKQKKGEYQLSSFSNYGETVTVCAPGVNVFSTIKSGGINGSYGYMDGTSMAAPIVSGITALVWSVDQEMSSGDVKQIITETTTQKVLSRRKNDTGTYYMIDAKSAVEKAVEKFETKSEQSQSKGQFDNSDLLDGAVMFNNHWYCVILDDSVTDWGSAQQYCMNHNGYLATITSQEENEFIYNYLTSGSGFDSAYFGLTDKNIEGVWEWSNGEEVTYTNWHRNEPNGENSNEDYGMFYYKYPEGTWNDGDFDNRTINDAMVFICEWGEYQASSNISAEPIRTTSDERDIVLVLDTSGSMSGTPVEEVKKASTKFVSTILKEDASIGIVTYASSANMSSDFSVNESQLQDTVNNISSGGGTNIESGLQKAEEMLESSNAKKQIIVLMSDGAPGSGKVGDELIAYADAIKDQGVYIYTLGFFGSIGDTKSSAQILMEELASDGCHYEVANAEDLVFFFGDIADQINGQKYIYVRIACPVDVTVTHDGETLCSVEDELCTRTNFGSITFEENAEETDEGEDNRIKVLRLNEGTDYDIRIEGNGRGHMDYTIGFMDENGEYSDLREFENIKITQRTIIETVAANSGSTILNVDEDGDGKFDLRYRATENGRGEVVDYTYFVYAIIILVLFLLVVIIIVKIKKTKNVRRII